MKKHLFRLCIAGLAVSAASCFAAQVPAAAPTLNGACTSHSGAMPVRVGQSAFLCIKDHWVDPAKTPFAEYTMRFVDEKTHRELDALTWTRFVGDVDTFPYFYTFDDRQFMVSGYVDALPSNGPALFKFLDHRSNLEILASVPVDTPTVIARFGSGKDKVIDLEVKIRPLPTPQF